MTDTLTAFEPVTTCGACQLRDDHPKHQILVGFNNEHTDGMFHEHDLGENSPTGKPSGLIYYHLDCPTPWHDLHAKLAVDPFPASDPSRPWEAWEQGSADEHRAIADLHASVVAKAREGVHGDELRQWIVNLNQRGGAGGIDQTLATATLAALAINSSTATIGTRTVTGPQHLRLMTANGSDSSAGTELGTSGGYTAGGSSISFGAASAGSVTNSGGATSWTNMPSTTLTGCEEWDTSGTPLRNFWAPWSSGSIVVASGNTFTVSSSALTNTLS